MSRLTRIFPVIVLAVCARGVLAQGMPPAKVVLDEARQETLVERRGVTGEIRTLMRSQLAVQVEGLIIEMNVDEGDEVRKGQVLAQIDPTRAKMQHERALAEVHHAEAVIEQRQAELDEARRDLERFEELDRRGSAGVTELDEARTLLASRSAMLAQAQADLSTARAELNLAERELSDTRVVAPFNGHVVRTHTEVGQWIDRGGDVATIVALDALEARIDIPQQYYQALSDNTESIEIIVPALGAEPLEGALISIIPEADSLSRLFPVRIRVMDPKHRLRPGMSLTAMVPTGVASDMLTVSKDAIVHTISGEHLFFNADGIAAMMPVTRVFGVGDRVAIRAGVLRPGMQVVVDGNERLTPGQPLQIMGQPESAIPNAAAKSGEGN